MVPVPRGCVCEPNLSGSGDQTDGDRPSPEALARQAKPSRRRGGGQQEGARPSLGDGARNGGRRRPEPVTPAEEEETLNAMLETEADTLCLYGRHVDEAHRGGEVRNVSVLIAVGVGEQGYREVLAPREKA